MATLSMTNAQVDAYRAALNSAWQAGTAIPTNDLSITTTTLGGIWQDAATQQQTYQYMQFQPAWSDAITNAIRKIRFWRVNKVVEINEGAKFEDPVDELRLKVARWLNPCEKHNFAT
jgi:Tfp pilus assembly protein PilV